MSNPNFLQKLDERKSLTRIELKKRRCAICDKRRKEAAERLLTLLPLLASYQNVLSFVSLSKEIDTSLLNEALALQNCLLLPQVSGTDLKVHRVVNFASSLKEVSKNSIQLILVPALGFDKTNHRIGYGNGYYDRFLASIPNCPTRGLGFKEQLVHSLPIESTDFPLKAISLF